MLLAIQKLSVPSNITTLTDAWNLSTFH